ncbi:MAG: M48 family metalloprotease [Candidatus Eiseniibacteriota bacterium]
MRVSTSVLLATAALALGGCAGSKGQERQIPVPLSDQHERIIGSRLAKRFETGVDPELDPRISDYLNQICGRIGRLSDRPDIPYTVSVYRAPEPRAMAFPGGFIYVSTGLLKMLDTESEVAGVIGHEVTHVVLRHPSGVLERGLNDADLAAIVNGPKGADTTGAGTAAMRLLSMGYGRGVETTTDVTAMLYVSRAGINPEGMVQAMEKLNPSNSSVETFWEISSNVHPHMIDRIASNRSELKSMGLDAGLSKDQPPYAPIKKLLK